MQLQVLLLCSIHNWVLNLRDKYSSHCHPSLPALHPHCCHWGPECHCPYAGRCLTHFSGFSQLTLPNLFATTWWLVHAPCYYSSINAQILLACKCSHTHYAQHNWHKPSCTCKLCSKNNFQDINLFQQSGALQQLAAKIILFMPFVCTLWSISNTVVICMFLIPFVRTKWLLEKINDSHWLSHTVLAIIEHKSLRYMSINLF